MPFIASERTISTGLHTQSYPTQLVIPPDQLVLLTTLPRYSPTKQISLENVYHESYIRHSAVTIFDTCSFKRDAYPETTVVVGDYQHKTEAGRNDVRTGPNTATSKLP